MIFGNRFRFSKKVEKTNYRYLVTDTKIPEDIYEFNKELNKWEYAIYVNGKVINNPGGKDFMQYKSIPINIIDKKHVGVCWDFVNYEAKWFKDHGYNYETYFIIIDDNHNCPSHTFLLFEYNNKVYYFESSWKRYQGIEEFKNINIALKTIIDRHILHYGEESRIYSSSNSDKIYCYKYDTTGMDNNLTAMEYMNTIMEKGTPIKVTGIKMGMNMPNTDISESYINEVSSYHQYIPVVFTIPEEYYNEAVGVIRNMTIVVNPNEAPIPHFHIIIPEKQDCCICIYEPLYFSHDGKETKLTKSEMKVLNKWLKSSNKISNGTNWDAINSMWCNMYYLEYKPHTKIIEQNLKTPQPEYTYNMDNKF